MSMAKRLLVIAGIFNLADVAIMAGVVMLLIGRRESRRTIWMR